MVQIADNTTCDEGSNSPEQNIKSVKVRDCRHLYTLEEAIEEAKFGKSQVILTLLTGLSIVGSAIENVNVSFILPYAKCDLELRIQEQGVLSGISFFGIVFSSHLWGFLADTWGRKKVLRMAAIGGFMFSFLSAFSVNTISMILLRFLAGAFVAGATSAGFSYISEFHTSATAPRAAAFISIGLNLAWSIISPLARVIIPMDWSYALYFIEFKPWRLFLLCTSMIHLLNIILLSFLPESPKFLLAMNRKQEALDVLGRIYAINTGNSKNIYPVKDIERVTLGNSLLHANGIGKFLRLIVKQTVPVLQQPMLTNTWKLCFIIFSIFLVSHGTIMWVPVFLTQLHNHKGSSKILCEIVGPKATASLNSTIHTCTIDNKNVEAFEVMFVMGLCLFFLAAISSFLFTKIAPKKIVCSWLILSMLAVFLLNVFTEFYVIVVDFIIFLSCGVCANIVLAIGVNLYPTNYRAMATALIMVCGRIGSISGSSTIGLLLDNYCTSIYYTSSGILFCCVCVFIMIEIKTR